MPKRLKEKRPAVAIRWSRLHIEAFSSLIKLEDLAVENTSELARRVLDDFLVCMIGPIEAVKRGLLSQPDSAGWRPRWLYYATEKYETRDKELAAGQVAANVPRR